ncbi:MAG TPA: 4Fe-4S dicluster domain-containing protein [Candidatus Dormibacteraeota bacterium]|nr:4Fe-4S dicluster domain-containing protein [Candidatus Dormibacteraeota bacterium]
MGHLRHMKEEYQELVARLNAGQVGLPEPESAPARKGWQEILEILYTPEEAWLGARMPLMPATLDGIARRVGLAEEALKPRLEAMADKGIVMDLVNPETGETRYLLSPPVVGFFEFSMMRHDDLIPKQRMAEALDAYTHGDDTFAREVFGGDTVIGRAMVHETALGDGVVPEVLDWERATAAIRDASSIAVQTCYCRHKAAHLGKQCDAPVDTCMSLNAGADFVIRHRLGRPAEKSEALEILSQARARGLVQIADNVQNRPTYLCNCCGCCCGQLQPINDFGLPAVNPSGFQPVLHLERCKGCSRCARACQVTAIAMLPHRVAAKRKNDLVPQIDSDRCIGCGVCADTCLNGAMVMERRTQRPYVPLNTIERSVRMALERGKLPHLLFDVGASRGSRFLNAVMRALCALSPVERVLASEQVRSRFVRYALQTAQDPTGGH